MWCNDLIVDPSALRFPSHFNSLTNNGNNWEFFQEFLNACFDFFKFFSCNVFCIGLLFNGSFWEVENGSCRVQVWWACRDLDNDTEAAIQKCSYEKVFRKYAANLQENTHAKVWLQ